MLKKWVLGLALLLGGCASAPVVQQAQGVHLDRNQLIYVGQSQSAFPAENATSRQLFARALSGYAQQVFQSKGEIPVTLLPQIAQTMRGGYIFYIDVLQWEDHNTPWTTLRDKVTLRVMIIDVRTEKIVLDEQLKGVSKLWVARNEKPDVVAQDLITNFVNGLFK